MMKSSTALSMIFLTAFLPWACKRAVSGRVDYPAEAVPFTRVAITDQFWGPRLEASRRVTVPYLLKKSAENGIILEADPTYKTIEGAAYTLLSHPDAELEAALSEIVDGAIDGLIPKDPGKKWTSEYWDRELYPGGHFIEAALAVYQATGKRKMLDAAIKIADWLVDMYGPGKRHQVPTHEEIEIALVRLYRLTGEEKYLNLAKFFLDERGRDTHPNLGEYAQDHNPVVEQTKAVGHCVMAMYLYSAMTDVAALTGDPAYAPALDRLWDDVVSRKVYLTGGIGAIRFHERFGAAYELPNLSGWAETCATYGNTLWNHRLFLLHREGKYADMMERCLYNGFLVGVSLKGDRFFYQNPLKSFGTYARFSWINVPCCPPNVLRLLSTLGSYIYARSGDDIYLNLFIGSRADVPMPKNEVILTQETRYPWEGRVKVTVDPDRSKTFAIYVRIPGWTQGQVMPGDLYRYLDRSEEKVRLAVNGKPLDFTIENGYAGVRRKWSRGDTIELDLPMPVRKVAARGEVVEDRDSLALMRGPLVYCAEGPDNEGNVLNLVFPENAELRAEYRSDLLDGVEVITGDIAALARGREDGRPKLVPHRLTAIPYYAWANRGMGEMAVWLPARESKARLSPILLPDPISRVSSFGALEKRITGYNDQSDDICSVYDGVEPLSSADESSLYFRLKPPERKPAWVEYEFKRPTTVSSAEVYWVDDRRFCRLPASWRILYEEVGQWKPVVPRGSYGVEKDKFNRVDFDPVRTRALRLEVEPQTILYRAGKGGPPDAMPIKEDVEWRECGIIEWRVK